VLVHMKRQLRGIGDDFDVAIFGHTHKPRVECDHLGRILINPGETSGWSFGRATVAMLDTHTRKTEVVDLRAVAS
jgi:predicted phosphodiesterase